MGWILYQVAMAAGLIAAAPFLLVRRGRHYLETLSGRLGNYSVEEVKPGGAGALWIHAVSVGEVGVAATLARSLPDSVPLLVTTVTPTGQKRAREIFAAHGAAVAYLPFDFSFALKRFFRRFSPAALILVEGDYWPLTLRYAADRGLPVAVVNGRVSARSFQRLQRLGKASERLFFSSVRRFGTQTEEDRRRLIELGARSDRVVLTGNLKYDSPAPAPLPELEAAMFKLAAGRPILIAGSTMRGEEELVLRAFARLGGERALLMLVPRHPERWDGVARQVEERGLRLQRRSEMDVADPTGEADVVLLDSLGELAALYRIATIAFIGGTLVPTGGHNPLEPARFGVPVVVGPSMENFREIAERFNQARAWRQVADDAGLFATWESWLEAPAEAREIGRRGDELLRVNRGASTRTLDLLEPLLAAVRPPVQSG